MLAPLSAELLLAAACCRWPPSPSRDASVRAAAAAMAGWDEFLRIVIRHRVSGLVHDALAAAGVEVPFRISAQLRSRAEAAVRQNLLLLAELARLQRKFDAAQIPVLVA